MQGGSGEDRVLFRFGQEAVQVDDVVEAVVVDAFPQRHAFGAASHDVGAQAGVAGPEFGDRVDGTRGGLLTLWGGPRGGGGGGGGASCARAGPPLCTMVMGARHPSLSRMARREDSETVTVGQEA